DFLDQFVTAGLFHKLFKIGCHCLTPPRGFLLNWSVFLPFGCTNNEPILTIREMRPREISLKPPLLAGVFMGLRVQQSGRSCRSKKRSFGSVQQHFLPSCRGFGATNLQELQMGTKRAHWIFRTSGAI
ncbi:MAG: hypothetical protein ACR2O4_01715, partial [Hyphomicrobiaceae bacterium]